jgi:hypothetical protein
MATRRSISSGTRLGKRYRPFRTFATVCTDTPGEPKPFIWTADPDAIVEKVRRGYHVLASVGRQAG